MKNSIKVLSLCGGILAFCTAAQAQTTVIGDWEGGSTDGWSDWNGGTPVSISTLPSKYSFSTTTGVTLGSESLEVTQAGYNQGLAISLSPAQIADFLNDSELSFDLTYPIQTGSGYSQIYEIALNAPGYGFHALTADPVPGTSADVGNTTSTQTINFVVSYSSALASITANPGYVQFIFSSNNGNGAPDNFYLDNVQLVQTPEPTTLALAGLGGLASLVALRRKK